MGAHLVGSTRVFGYPTSYFDRDGGLFARVKIERANNTLRQAEFIIRFAAERKIVKYSSRCMGLEGRVTRARARARP